MFIQIETTPNAATMKFLPGEAVSPNGNINFPEAAEAHISPLAHRLFKISGVKGVFFGSDFISVTKSEEENWAQLRPLVLGAIMDQYQSGEPILSDMPQTASPESQSDESEIVVQIKELLETRIRPAVAQDGGDIVFHGFENGVVYLRMHGACAGCPSSTITLKMGIENLLRHYIPDVTEVRAVD